MKIELIHNSIIAAFDRSDRAVMTSVLLLGIGTFLPVDVTTSATITLPGGLQFSNAQQAYSAILLINFLNGVRYCFYLNRARQVSKFLTPDYVAALSTHPSPATSSFMTEVVQTGIMGALTFQLLARIEVDGFWTTLIFTNLLILPFMSGAVMAFMSLDFAKNSSRLKRIAEKKSSESNLRD